MFIRVYARVDDMKKVFPFRGARREDWFSTTIIEEATWLVSGLLSGPREKTEDFLQSKESKAGWGAGLGGEGELSIYKPNPCGQPLVTS